MSQNTHVKRLVRIGFKTLVISSVAIWLRNCQIVALANAGQDIRPLGKVNRPTMFFYLAVATSTAKISLGRNVSIFMKRETLQKRHKQSNKHVFRVCMHSYMYITKVT